MENNKQLLTNAYNEHSDAIFRYCLYKISDREKALDFTQETFVRTWQYILKGNKVENVKTFLYTTARNIIIDEYRKKKPLSLDQIIDDGFEPSFEIEETLYNEIEASKVIGKINELPEQYSSILLMRYVNDLSIKDISEIMKESENVVSVRIHRGLSKLKTLVSQ